HVWIDLLRYAGTNVTALIINMLLLTIFVDLMRWPAIPVQLVIACIVVTFTYFGHKHVSFRRS
ncbi:MAG: GtrA family protein, partial [Ktedonobacteraceae bacterium]